MGQEFRPALNSLSFIDLMIWDFFGQGSGPGNLQVNVRSDTINGPIIGTSSILILQRGFQGIAHFDFPGIVPLNPGSLYVMSPRVVDGGDWGVGASGLNAYPDGQKIRMGAFVPGDDLFFREGTVVVPEPTSAAFLVLGLVVVIGWRRFYYSRRSPVSAARLLPNSQGVQWCSSRHL